MDGPNYGSKVDSLKEALYPHQELRSYDFENSQFRVDRPLSHGQFISLKYPNSTLVLYNSLYFYNVVILDRYTEVHEMVCIIDENYSKYGNWW